MRKSARWNAFLSGRPARVHVKNAKLSTAKSSGAMLIYLKGLILTANAEFDHARITHNMMTGKP